ncbi:MAG: hypothetical protein AB1598_05265 [Thermodesulfobacteriota bacterium]
MPVLFRIKKNYFQDALRLMRISKTAGGMDGVKKATAVMATEKAKFALETAGLLTREIKDASGGDLVIAVEAASEAAAERALDAMEEMISAGSSAGGSESRDIFNRDIRAVNIGLDIFRDALEAQGVKVVQVDWEVPAGGDEKIIDILKKMY